MRAMAVTTVLPSPTREDAEMETVLLTPQGAAKLLGLAEQTLARWRVRGEGPRYQKLGGRVRYSATELERWVAERTHRSTAEVLARRCAERARPERGRSQPRSREEGLA